MEHYKIDITEEQRSNLKKLADYLLSGNLRAEFDIATFAETSVTGRYTVNCGSVGCSIGHGPYVGLVKLLNETWVQYAHRVFGSEMDVFMQDRLFNWCFESDWSYVDNTPQGAAKRILYMLEHGIPATHLEQINEDEPLCY